MITAVYYYVVQTEGRGAMSDLLSHPHVGLSQNGYGRRDVDLHPPPQTAPIQASEKIEARLGTPIQRSFAARGLPGARCGLLESVARPSGPMR